MDPILKQLLQQYPLDEQANGLVRFYAIDRKNGHIRKLIDRTNLILYSGADILAKLLSGAGEYSVNTMYLEFLNLANPLDPITPPPYDRTGGINYYNSLTGPADSDFLRVPLDIVPRLNATNANYENNKVTFFGISEGTVGFQGKTFNPAMNSAVFGAALVAAPDVADQSRDLVFSRVYAGIDKVLKETGFEIGVTWTIEFK